MNWWRSLEPITRKLVVAVFWIELVICAVWLLVNGLAT